jgi:hypothetical protein
VDGDTGAASLRDLCDKHGDGWTRTLTCVTARGKHLYFKTDTAIKCSASKIATGLDVRGDGGYVVVPPSLHPSGRYYEWENEEVEPIPAPAWLLALAATLNLAPVARRRRTIRQEPRPTATVRTTTTPQRFDILTTGRRNNGLTSYAGKLRCNGMTQEQIETDLLAANELRCRPRLSEWEVRGIAASVSRYETAGRDVLEQAWQQIQADEYPDGYSRFLALCAALQAARPGQSIALPLERIAGLMEVKHYEQVRRWRQRAVKQGRLTPTERYIPHKRAAGYRYGLVADGPGQQGGRDDVPTPTVQ